MNKIKKLLLFFFVAVFSLAMTTNAEEIKSAKGEGSVAGSSIKANSLYESQVDDPYIDGGYYDESVWYDGAKYWLGSKIISGVSDNTVNNVRTLKYYDSITKTTYTSTYKKIGSYYAHEKISGVNTTTGSAFDIKFYNIESSCDTSKTQPYRGNCTKYFQVKSLDFKEVDSTGTKVISRTYSTYSQYASKYYDYKTIEFYKLSSGKLYKYFREDAPRKANSNEITAIKQTKYYTNGKAKNYVLYQDLGYVSSRASAFYYSKVTKQTYNTAGKTTAKAVQYPMKRWDSKKGKYVKYIATTYKQNVSYYGNKKTPKVNQILKRNKANKLTGAKKVGYRSTGKKYWYKVRSFKSGVVKKQYYTVYNKKGNVKGSGAYRITVNYSKKGKATSAYKAKYKSNGKLGGAYRIGLKKSVYGW